MNINEDKLNQLSFRLNKLIRNQQFFHEEIKLLKQEIEFLKRKEGSEASFKASDTSVKPNVSKTTGEIQKIVKQHTAKQEVATAIKKKPSFFEMFPKDKKDWESFIGGNLINKIGILITVIGIAVGAKYSIDKGWVTPLMRIILGYLSGIGLLGFAFKLKMKYSTFSAVLLSGAIAVLYFITFFAYNEYSLIPQTFAFILMVVITVFAVFAAIRYDEKIIAILGLVGAYAVPFLLSEGSGKVVILFSYITLINIGILVVAYKKYWKSLYYIAFGFTVLIFVSWFNLDYKSDIHFYIALLFSTIYFLLFYATFLIYKLKRKEEFVIIDVFLVTANSFIYYFIGFGVLEGNYETDKYLGLFTLFNALIHFIIGSYIYKQQQKDKDLFYLVLGMVLLFLTIAIPVQLDGNWVTILWTGEAALLFWIGRTKNISMYEKMAYPLFFIAFFSLLQDWSESYYGYKEEAINTIFNLQFITSLLFIIGFAWINWLFFTKENINIKKSKLISIITILLPTILVIAAYLAFKMEIHNYFNNVFDSSSINLGYEIGGSVRNYDLLEFETIWVINYTVLFISLLSILSVKKLKSVILNNIAIVLSGIGVLLFLMIGLYSISELRESYVANDSKYYTVSIYHILIRYISYLFIGLLSFVIIKKIKPLIQFKNISRFIDLFMHLTLLWIVTSELIHWLDLLGSKNQYKLGVSILWGVYSLAFICIGLWKKKKMLRFGAIALFGLTLIKLFFYDIAHLPTISKTIVLTLLGVLLLVISFLYNKFKDRIEVDQHNNIDNNE